MADRSGRSLLSGHDAYVGRRPALEDTAIPRKTRGISETQPQCAVLGKETGAQPESSEVREDCSTPEPSQVLTNSVRKEVVIMKTK